MTRAWTPATVLHDDLLGTTAADFPDSLRELSAVAGLGDDWLVVGLDLAGSYRTSWGALLAVPVPPGGRFVSWSSLVASGGGVLAVRRFPLERSDAGHHLGGGLGVLTQLKRWSVRLLIAPLQDVRVEVLVDE